MKAIKKAHNFKIDKKDVDTKLNMDLNFKREEGESEKEEKLYPFFNCGFCGFHESVIEKHWLKGDIDNFNLIIKEIHPHYEKTHSMIGDSLKKDGILCTEYYCGKCHNKGDMLPVPSFALDMFGFKVPDSESQDNKNSEDSKKSNLLNSLKGLFSKKASKKKTSKGNK